MNLSNIQCTGKSKEADAVKGLQAAFINGLEMSDRLYTVLAAHAADGEVTSQADEAEINSVIELVCVMFPDKASDVLPGSFEAVLLKSAEVAKPAVVVDPLAGL